MDRSLPATSGSSPPATAQGQEVMEVSSRPSTFAGPSPTEPARPEGTLMATQTLFERIAKEAPSLLADPALFDKIDRNNKGVISKEDFQRFEVEVLEEEKRITREKKEKQLREDEAARIAREEEELRRRQEKEAIDAAKRKVAEWRRREEANAKKDEDERRRLEDEPARRADDEKREREARAQLAAWMAQQEALLSTDKEQDHVATEQVPGLQADKERLRRELDRCRQDVEQWLWDDVQEKVREAIAVAASSKAGTPSTMMLSNAPGSMNSTADSDFRSSEKSEEFEAMCRRTVDEMQRLREENESLRLELDQHLERVAPDVQQQVE